jgi:O-antigen ligase
MNRVLELLLYTILIIMGFRPIFDLQGRYQGEGLNLGGAMGGIISVLIIIMYLLSTKKKSLYIGVTIISIFLIVLLWLTKIILEFDSQMLVQFGRFLIGFIPILLIFIIIKDGILKKAILKYNKAFILACIVPIVISWLQYLGFYPYSYFDVVNGVVIGRPSGGYYQPSSLSRLMIFLLIYSYIYYIKGLFSGRIKLLMVFLAVSTSIISTHRTTTLIILLLIILFEMYILLKKNRVSIRTIVQMIISIPFFIGSYFIFNLDQTLGVTIKNSVSKMLDAKGSLNANSDQFLRGRGMRWERTIDYMDQQPIISKMFGVGYEVYESHNDLLNIYLLNGLIGVICFIVIFISVFVYVWKQLNFTGKFLLFSLYSSFLLFGITMQPSFYPNFMWMFFIAILYIISFYNKSETNILMQGVNNGKN